MLPAAGDGGVGLLPSGLCRGPFGIGEIAKTKWHDNEDYDDNNDGALHEVCERRWHVGGHQEGGGA